MCLEELSAEDSELRPPHPMMLFLPSLVVIMRATLEPDATIDPSLHHLSQAFFFVTRNFYYKN